MDMVESTLGVVFEAASVVPASRAGSRYINPGEEESSHVEETESTKPNKHQIVFSSLLLACPLHKPQRSTRP